MSTGELDKLGGGESQPEGHRRNRTAVAETFRKHLEPGGGLDRALQALLDLATNDDKLPNGKPVVAARTRRMAAVDFAKLCLAATQIDRKGGAAHGHPDAPNLPDLIGPDGIGVVRIQQVEAILANDDALRASLATLRRVADGDRSAGSSSGVRVSPIPGQVDPRTAP